ncbi:DedA family protein [Bacillus sp. Y1]|jgi:membrane protein DedA with SNARE-associated domain|uniref:DedA family protein n=1 Tax=Robertmurraya sp. TaxID=2837525 RepID=UPI000E6AF001|nr:DedA family protein [Bacillus sp. Y1]AYA77690.1 DedA family protein [Bacillus sp. Y1]
MEEWIFSIIENYGYLGVFLIIVIENVFPPIPSELVLPFSGFMTTKTELSVAMMIVASTAGSVVGGTILYYIGTILDVERLEKIVDRWGKYLQLKREDVYKADAWFDRYGIWTVFFCRMVPLLRSLISVPAGMSNMKMPLFLLFTLLGTAIWNTLLIVIGAKLGENWTQILSYTEVYSDIIYAVGAIAILAVLIFFGRRFFYKK